MNFFAWLSWRQDALAVSETSILVGRVMLTLLGLSFVHGFCGISGDAWAQTNSDGSRKLEQNKSGPSSATAGNLVKAGSPGVEFQDREAGLPLSEFRPESMLRVKQSPLGQSKFPSVDIHSHFRHRLKHDPEQLRDYIAVMDRNRIAVSVSMDGRLGDELEDHKDYLWSQYPDRFVIFANLDFQGSGDANDPSTWACNQPDFARDSVERLRMAKRAGVSGLKLFKQFGLSYRNADGSLIAIDDPRFDPIWKCCGELQLPVLIHTADPAAFFRPITPSNERWEELSRHPDWSFYGEDYPDREELLEQRNRVLDRHPKTQFIGAHVANNAEDLQQVGEWLDRYPNLSVEIASRIGELGRQPYTARRFLMKYQDRVLFGTDGPWPETRLHLYWRFLETDDEYFPYSEKPFPPQGFWQIYGMFLPDEVLEKIYFRNSFRLIEGLEAKYTKTVADWNEKEHQR